MAAPLQNFRVAKLLSNPGFSNKYKCRIPEKLVMASEVCLEVMCDISSQSHHIMKPNTEALEKHILEADAGIVTDVIQ